MTTMKSVIEAKVEQIKKEVGREKALMALSGGVSVMILVTVTETGSLSVTCRPVSVGPKVRIPAQDCHVRGGVTLAACGLCAGKVAIERDASDELEGGAAVCAGCRLVGARRHPDFSAGGWAVERGLQCAGIGPTGAVAGSGGGRLGVEHSGCAHSGRVHGLERAEQYDTCQYNDG